MFKVELYGRVRRAVLVDGLSQREVAREFGISRTTIQKMLRYAVPLGGGAHPGGEERQRTRAFSELSSHYLFASKFGRPARGNDKGKVEGLVGYARRNFMVPVPRFSNWEEWNEYLAQQCRQRRERRLRGHAETIGERFERDRAALLPLPAAAYEACEKVTARVN